QGQASQKPNLFPLLLSTLQKYFLKVSFKIIVFTIIIDQHLSSWKARTLSFEGCMTIVNSVLQSPCNEIIWIKYVTISYGVIQGIKESLFNSLNV
ncbi:hypothetical protein CR513_58818, partial [Mucuna pruriens]